MFWWLVQNTLLAGMLALAAALAGRFGRLSPAVRHALWLVVLVKLITPPVAFYSLPEGEPWSDWLAPPTEQLTQAGSPSAGSSAAKTDLPAIQSDERAEIVDMPSHMGSSVIDLGAPKLAALPIEFDQAVAQGSDEQPRHEPTANASAATAWQSLNFAAIRSALIGVWAIGAGCMGLLQAVRLLHFKRLLQNTESAPRELNSLVERIAAQLGVSAPRVLLTSAACSPMVFAFGRPRLIWPNSLAEPLTGDARRAVIAHELAHLRRRDHWVGWLELAASCGWWWNPLFWYVRRQLHETAELACDAWVVSLLPGGRRAYAQALIDVSEMISWTAAPAPAVGMGANARHLFERRLTMILRERVPCRAPLIGLASIGLLGIAVLPGWTRGQAPGAENLAVDSLQVSNETSPDAVEQIDVAAERLDVRREDSEARPTEKAPPAEALHDDVEVRKAKKSWPARAPESEDPFSERYVQNRKLAEIKQLEARLAKLASELRALRGEETGGRKPDGNAGFRIDYQASKSVTRPVPPEKERPLFIARYSADRKAPNNPGEDIETLTRAKYKLPPGRAQALAAFIKAQVKEDVETRVDGETLIVTATADDQARIGQFVQLLKKTPEEPHVGQDNVQGATFYPSTQPVAIDAGFPVRVGETVPAIQPVLPASAAPSVAPAGPLPSLEESGAKGPLPPPSSDAVPTTIN